MPYCTNCGKETEWVSKSGYCKECAETALDQKNGSAGGARTPIYRKWWFWLIVVIILGSVANGLNSEGEPSGYFKADGSLKIDVAGDFKFIAQKAVKQYLKAPSTAEFETRYDQWASYGEDVYSLSGTFTAQNSFGVPLEDEYLVQFWYGGDYDAYEIRTVIIGDEVMYDKEN